MAGLLTSAMTHDYQKPISEALDWGQKYRTNKMVEEENKLRMEQLRREESRRRKETDDPTLIPNPRHDRLGISLEDLHPTSYDEPVEQPPTTDRVTPQWEDPEVLLTEDEALRIAVLGDDPSIDPNVDPHKALDEILLSITHQIPGFHHPRGGKTGWESTEDEFAERFYKSQFARKFFAKNPEFIKNAYADPIATYKNIIEQFDIQPDKYIPGYGKKFFDPTNRFGKKLPDVSEDTESYGIPGLYQAGQKRMARSPGNLIAANFANPNQGSTQQRAVSKGKIDTILNNAKGNIANGVLDSQLAKAIYDGAVKLGIDPITAVTILAMESNFGDVGDPNNPLQIQKKTYNSIREFFTDESVRKTHGTVIGNKDVSQFTGLATNTAKNFDDANAGDLIMMGLLRIKYSELVGVKREYMGAGYNGAAEHVDGKGKIKNVFDSANKIYTIDYNTGHNNLYNIINQHMNPLPSTTVAQTGTTPTTPSGQGPIIGPGYYIPRGGPAFQTDDVTQATPGKKSPDVGKDFGSGQFFGDQLTGSTPTTTTAPAGDFMKVGSSISYDTARATDMYNIIRRKMQIAKSAGDMKAFDALLPMLIASEGSVLHSAGQDGLSDFARGDNRRLDRLLSTVSGREVRSEIQSNGIVRVYYDGVYQYESTINDHYLNSRLLLDKAYKKSQAGLASEQAKQDMESRREIRKLIVESRLAPPKIDDIIETDNGNIFWVDDRGNWHAGAIDEVKGIDGKLKPGIVEIPLDNIRNLR